jgi:hypothetical protein
MFLSIFLFFLLPKKYILDLYSVSALAAVLGGGDAA